MNQPETVVVCHSPYIAEQISMVITRSSLEISNLFERGEDALTFCQQKMPDILIWYFDSCNLNELGILESIKDLNPDLPVAIFHGSQISSLDFITSKYSDFHFISFPSRLDDITEEFRNILNKLSKSTPAASGAPATVSIDLETIDNLFG